MRGQMDPGAKRPQSEGMDIDFARIFTWVERGGTSSARFVSEVRVERGGARVYIYKE